MGIKGTVRRSTDGHIIHANIDTDVIIAEEPPYGRFFLIPDSSVCAFYVCFLQSRNVNHEIWVAETDCMLLLSSTFQLFVFLYK